jgi:endonuclease VIII
VRIGHRARRHRIEAGMPEGHTIHRLALDLKKSLGGEEVRASSPQGRFPDATTLDRTVLRDAQAVGKHLLLYFGSEGAWVHVHLGLFGRFRPVRAPFPEPRPTVRLRLVGSRACWDLVGPTICEVIGEDAVTSLRARLGADPIANAARPRATWPRVHASKRSIGALLLDQSIFAGIGNVYRAELLFLLGVHPETRGNELTRKELEKLWSLARSLLARGVQANRIVTVEGATRRTRKRDALYVYRQRACRTCAGGIGSFVCGGRTIYYCPRCQPAR